MYLSLPINRRRGRLFCHAKPFGRTRGKKCRRKCRFFLFRMHYCSISRSGIPYNLSKKDADIFMLEYAKKGAIESLYSKNTLT